MNTTNAANPAPTVWPVVLADDAKKLINWLTTTFGFEETAVYTEGEAVVHAQLDWPEGGGVMLSDNTPRDTFVRSTGQAVLYVVTEHVDAMWQNALDAGAKVVREIKDEDYGNRDFVVEDPEGNVWSFGHYKGEPRKTG